MMQKKNRDIKKNLQVFEEEMCLKEYLHVVTFFLWDLLLTGLIS